MAFQKQAALTIDSEFKSLIPPLKEDELEQLELNLKAYGCRDALVFWQHEGKSILLDGHNRLTLCTKNNISYRLTEEKLESRAHARVWILLNQLGRRNLPDDQRAALALQAYKEQASLSKKTRAKQAADVRWGNAEAKGRGDRDTILTKFSKDVGVSSKKMRQLRELDLLDPSLLKKVASGEMKLADARETVRKIEQTQKLESKEVLKAKKADGKYDLIVCDPPWPSSEAIAVRDKSPYKRMRLDEIQSVLDTAFNNTASEDCHFFLWTNQKFLPMAFKMLEQSRFVYVCVFVWQRSNAVPVGPIMPQSNCDFAIYCHKGSPKFVTIKDLRTCFAATHTQAGKPKEFYASLVRCAAGRRLDMFETRKITGFDGWGSAAGGKSGKDKKAA